MCKNSRPHERPHERNDFRCIHCKQPISAIGWGTKNRNHCPLCLWSRHVDDTIGDRANPCRAPMEPIAIAVRDADDRGTRGIGEWCVIHRCTACGFHRTNRIAGDDRELTLLALALKPLAHPPFPLTDLR